MFTVPSNFIGTFKTGDNINYNLSILRLLYDQFGSGQDLDKQLLRKPIIVTLVSITEAILYDFHRRTRDFTIEGVETLADQVVDYIRGRKLEEFEKCIVSARKH